MNETAVKLIEVLHWPAIYNDEDVIWYRHSDEEIAAMHAKYRAQLDKLITQIGAENFYRSFCATCAALKLRATTAAFSPKKSRRILPKRNNAPPETSMRVLARFITHENR